MDKIHIQIRWCINCFLQNPSCLQNDKTYRTITAKQNDTNLSESIHWWEEVFPRVKSISNTIICWTCIENFSITMDFFQTAFPVRLRHMTTQFRWIPESSPTTSHCTFAASDLQQAISRRSDDSFFFNHFLLTESERITLGKNIYFYDYSVLVSNQIYLNSLQSLHFQAFVSNRIKVKKGISLTKL